MPSVVHSGRATGPRRRPQPPASDGLYPRYAPPAAALDSPLLINKLPLINLFNGGFWPQRRASTRRYHQDHGPGRAAAASTRAGGGGPTGAHGSTSD
ncbi:hypothetical protein PR371_13840 [Mycobacterium marinum]|uniref:hypothetical protein n=1 Tax=Mycobacterium marinum TaxID=1781 RepID=UPI002340F216|nr:hypothetical protein [Mycobacterium marinum]MDC8995060.1 hypothetical protein [Mycobacterium marinum]WDZ13706.1 hypothetical protein PQR73_024425 [Mycobacterium marinum]